MLMTSAWTRAAYMIPEMISANDPEPVNRSTLMAHRRASGATDAIPSPFEDTSDDTAVPCVLKSSMKGSLGTNEVLMPRSTFPTRSMWFGSTPVSRMHTRAPAPWCVVSQAASALICRMFHWNGKKNAPL